MFAALQFDIIRKATSQLIIPMKKNIKGFAIIEIIIVLVAILALGAGVWYFHGRQGQNIPQNNPVAANPGSQFPGGQPLSPYNDKIYATLSGVPNTFPAGTEIAEHASVPDVVQLTQDTGNYQKGDLLVYFVDFAAATTPGTESISVIVSHDNAKTWGSKTSLTITGKVNKGAVVDPSIAQLPDGRLRLYFFGSETTGGDPAQQQQPHRVYSALSRDGINFAVESGYRLEDPQLTDPEVIYWHNRWYMYYSVGANAELAVSNDGLNFTKQTLSDEGIGGVPGALALPGAVRLYGCNNGISTGLAHDGIHFIKDGSNIVSGATCDPSVIQLSNGSYLMIYKVSASPSGVSISQPSGASGAQNPPTPPNGLPVPPPLPNFGATDWNNGGNVISGYYADAFAVDLHNGMYRMYYAGAQQNDPTLPIYSATSTDGIHWSQEGSLRKTLAAFPDVLKLPNGKWRMYFQNQQLIKSAISTDGLTWTDESGVRMDASNSLGLALSDVNDFSVIQMQDGSYLMVYGGKINQTYPGPNVPNPQENVFLWATSTDGLNWHKQGMALDSRNSTYRGWVEGPDLVKWDDGSIRLYCWSYDGIYYSTYQNGSFSQGNLTFTQQDSQGNMFTQIPVADPALLKINNTWYMYYGQFQIGINYATLK